ncbi:alpha/beta hydrolase [Mucilaginibacter ginkgonis]|uniref:Alpha/beta hydrolase n=1 Tax=Mucilaginibacter ginkgonis TaxID=2682091 RepID=A0A7T7JGR3_9SPHI|nr:alpha/beta hydrolase [Mucilaginibacter ginkgonis]QQL49780.1 alpha/beta hydrolase [Mucilaginibacter ginkgonis]
MHIKALLPLILILACATSQAQQLRYKDFVFTNVKVDFDRSYDNAGKDKKSHRFDLYTPSGDNETKRPLIIWMHGGGFIFGSKGAPGTTLWSETFAKRGYVCADINYNLGSVFTLASSSAFKRSSYDAVQDCRMAVAYFRAHASEYGIDPDKIILAGNSAGGIMALLTAYTTNYELATRAGLKADTKGVDFSKEKTRVAGIINFWGGLMDVKWLKNARVPIVSCYGSRDSLVHPGYHDGFYGSIAIHKEADVLHIPNNIKVFEGYSHELQKHFNPVFKSDDETKERWLQAGQFSADFMYREVIHKVLNE